jgi:hypothetical protein
MGENIHSQPQQVIADHQQPSLIVPESKGMHLVYGLATIALPFVSFFLLAASGRFFLPRLAG